MRGPRLLGFAVVVAVTGLLSGAAAGAGPTTTAIISAAAGVLSGGLGAGPVTVPAAPAPAPAAVPEVPVPAAVPPAPAAVPPAPAAAPAPAKPAPRAVAGTPCLSTASACIDLSANKAWLVRDGVVQYGPVPITHGRKGYRTPPGTFRVSFKNKDHRSSIFDDAPMPYSVFFNGGIAFHQGSLKVLSHGCIHLSRAAAQTFFGSLSRGDVVQVVR
jgi:3-oxoacyl-[acyl-carrier protein] reductase